MINLPSVSTAWVAYWGREYRRRRLGVLSGLILAVSFGNGVAWSQQGGSHATEMKHKNRAQLWQEFARATTSAEKKEILSELKAMTLKKPEASRKGEESKTPMTEAEMRSKVWEYFQRFKDLEQDIEIELMNRTNSVEDHLELESDDVFDIVVDELIDRSMGVIGKIPVPGAGEVGEVLSAWKNISDKINERTAKNERILGMIEVKENLEEKFKRRKQAFEKLRDEVLSDPKKLEEYSKKPLLKHTVGLVEKIGREYELAVWKKLLPQRWKVLRTNTGYVYGREAFDRLRVSLNKDPERLVEWHRKIAPGLLDGKDGWTKIEYRLGAPGYPGSTDAPRKLMERIRSLGVSKRELFKEWGLPVASEVLIRNDYIPR